MLTSRTPSADFFSLRTTAQAFDAAGYFPSACYPRSEAFERSAHEPDLTGGWPEALRKYERDDLVITTLGLLTYFLREVHSSFQSFRSKILRTM